MDILRGSWLGKCDLHNYKWVTFLVEDKAADKVMKEIRLVIVLNGESQNKKDTCDLKELEFDQCESCIKPRDWVEFENIEILRSMKGDSDASACNTPFESDISSSNTTRTTRGSSGQAH